MQKPVYLNTKNKGFLENKIRELEKNTRVCQLCPRQCGVNRLLDEKGFCGLGKDLYISSYNLHFGEEPPISGINGSGTIFFTRCNLHCVFCHFLRLRF